MTYYITVPPTLNDAVGRTAISIKVISIIALVIDQQPISAYLVAFPIIIQSITCHLVAGFALFVAQEVGVLTEESFCEVAVYAVRMQCVAGKASLEGVQVLAIGTGEVDTHVLSG